MCNLCEYMNDNVYVTVKCKVEGAEGQTPIIVSIMLLLLLLLIHVVRYKHTDSDRDRDRDRRKSDTSSIHTDSSEGRCLLVTSL